jgi:hypothetical protein
MKEDRETYFYNPYLPENREDKGERMSIIRATLIICATVLISVVAFIFTNSQQERFVITAGKDGIFIFDQKTSATNYCSNTECKMITSEFILPKFTTIVETIPTNQQQLSPQAQSQLVNPNFGMPTSNQGQQQQPTAAAGAPMPSPAQQPAAAGAPPPPQQPAAGVPNQFGGNVNPAQQAGPAGGNDQNSDDSDNSDASEESGEDASGEGEEE